MPPATDPPCCSSRSAKKKPYVHVMALLFACVWFTTAEESLFAGTPEFRFIGPTNRMQLRQADEARTSANSPPPLTQHVRVSTGWRPQLAHLQNAKPPRVQGDLPTPRERIKPPALSNAPKEDGTKSDSPSVIVTDKQSEPALDQANPRQAPCFVAAPMASLTANIALPHGTLPEDVAAKCIATTVQVGDSRMHGGWATTEHYWSATSQRHQPLYFEEVNAERYGYTPAYRLQPLISAGRFFVTIPALPYKMAVDCPRDCAYTLGHDRPGSCGPRRRHRLPYQTRAVLAQTGMIVGLILLIP